MAAIAAVAALVIAGGIFFMLHRSGPDVARATPTAATVSPAVATTEPATATTPMPTDTPSPEPTTVPDTPELQNYMLSLVNDDRRAQGLTEVKWDNTAATAGLRHAQEMANFNYLSHWDLEGHGPDYRYSMEGGTDFVQENVYRYIYTATIGLTSRADWKELIFRAEQALMTSPAHRDNILSPEHTHVGIGIVYDANPTGLKLYISQEFINRYLTLRPFPHRATVGDNVTLAGRIIGSKDTWQKLFINLAYEPFPSPMNVEDLNATGTYTSPAEIYDSLPLTVNPDGSFEQSIALDYDGKAGLYHIIIVGDNTEYGQTIVADVVIESQ